MDTDSIFDVWNYNRAKDENLQNEMKKLMQLVDGDFKGIITNSFKNGFDEGEKYGRHDSNLVMRAKVVSKLLINTNFTDDDIFKIVGFEEEKWKIYVSDFRKKFEEGKREGMQE